MNKILVTYASRTGSTAGVAETIGRKLTEEGIQADVYPMQDVNDLDGYDAVIAGSAIQAAQWLPEAMQFLHNNRKELSVKPVAIFTVCMTLAMKNGEKYRQAVEQWIEPVRKLVNPLSEGLFKGILDIRKVPSLSQRIKFRLSVLMGVWKEGDHRDWVAIAAWSEDLKRKLS
jgi:menaquinone-dependent protoporphyrinogen oxidase